MSRRCNCRTEAKAFSLREKPGREERVWVLH